MEFAIPLKYLVNENTTQFIDRDLWITICNCLSCKEEGISFIDEDTLTIDTLMEFIEDTFPENEYWLDDGIMRVQIWDYYDYSFDRILDYCIQNHIPINIVQIPESSTECRYYRYYRPGFEKVKIIDANDFNEAVVPINLIMGYINDAEEDKTDTNIMIDISNKLEELNPNSELNNLKNWA